jgi:uncharacterized membrane protein YqjE
MAAPTGVEPDLHDRSIAELLKQLSNETTTLVQQELDLVKAEMSEKAKEAGKGAGMFGGAGLFGLGAFGALTACIIALLATAMDTWLAALIVTAVYGAIAGVLALIGRRKLQEAAPPKPEQTVETLKEDAQWAKTQMRSGAR